MNCNTVTVSPDLNAMSFPDLGYPPIGHCFRKKCLRSAFALGSLPETAFGTLLKVVTCWLRLRFIVIGDWMHLMFFLWPHKQQIDNRKRESLIIMRKNRGEKRVFPEKMVVLLHREKRPKPALQATAGRN